MLQAHLNEIEIHLFGRVDPVPLLLPSSRLMKAKTTNKYRDTGIYTCSHVYAWSCGAFCIN